jgi:hypothetical protein
VIASEICRDREVELANGGLSSAKYIQITDFRNPTDFTDAAADGYDLEIQVVKK